MESIHGRNGRESVHSDVTAASSTGQALLGVLPFFAFGVASMLSKTGDLLGYSLLVFYALTLLGLWIGWGRGCDHQNYPVHSHIA